MDVDKNGKIELDEWIQFWNEVKLANHSDDEIREELNNIKEGKSWICFNDVNPSKNKS